MNLATAATVLAGEATADGRRGARARRCDAAHPGAARGGLAGRGAPARARIRNPLTPIQLSAERLRRHFAGAAPPTDALVGECTDAIIAEVEALKGLVDEFAQFARLRGSRMVPTDVNRLIEEALQLYDGGVMQPGGLHMSASAARAPPVRAAGNAEQIRAGHHQSGGQRDGGALGAPAAPPRPGGERPRL